MGWWKTDEGHLIGDGPIDQTEIYLSRLADDYLNDHGRKPTLDELLACVSAALNASLDDYLESPAAVQIVALSAKTKRLPKLRRLRPGTLFSVPLDDGLFAFGRLTPQDGVAEFYRVKSRRRLSARKLHNCPVFRLKPTLTKSGFRNGVWVAYAQINYPADGFVQSPYRIVNQMLCGTEVVGEFIHPSSACRPATDIEMETIPNFSIANEAMVKHLLGEALSDAPLV